MINIKNIFNIIWDIGGFLGVASVIIFIIWILIKLIVIGIRSLDNKTKKKKELNKTIENNK